MPTQKVLILLEESRPDALPWPDDLGGDTVKTIVDWICETFESISTQMATCGAYDKVVQLIDVNCTYEKLASALVDHTVQGCTIDLVVLGHGSNNSITLHGGTTIDGDKIRAIKLAANQKGCKHVNLRMVYMCNCWGSTLNGAWLDIGAQVAVGPKRNDYMPEPMTADFLALWAELGKSASDAASQAYDHSKAVYWGILIPDPITWIPVPWVGILYESQGWFGDSELIVDGNKGITKNFLYAGKPAFPEEVTNLPPYLKDVVVAQPSSPANPSAFGAFPGRAANVRYSGSWSGGLSSPTRELVLVENGLLDPGKLSYVFLRFGPLGADGKYREMNAASLTLAATKDSNWTGVTPLHAAFDADGAYYWASHLLGNTGTAAIEYKLKVDGKDTLPHQDRPSGVRGDQVDSDPRSAASVDLTQAGFPFTAYTPGPDCTRKFSVAKTPKADAREPNNTFDSATAVDLRSTNAAEVANLTLYPSNDIDYFRITLPSGPDVATWPGGNRVPTGGNRWFSVSSWAASVRVEVTFEDLGEGTPAPDVHVFDGQRAEKTSGGGYIMVWQPGAAFPDHTLFVKVGSAVPKCVNYKAKFTYVPAGWSMSVHPPKLADVRQLIKNPRDPRISEILEDRGRPVENPADALSAVAKGLDYTAIDAIKSQSTKTAAAGFLVGLGEVLAAVGAPEAQQVLEKAEGVAQKSGNQRLVTGALNSQESLFKAAGNKTKLAQVRKRIKGLKTAVVVAPHR